VDIFSSLMHELSFVTRSTESTGSTESTLAELTAEEETIESLA
jgi:hypothetical protein